MGPIRNYQGYPKLEPEPEHVSQVPVPNFKEPEPITPNTNTCIIFMALRKLMLPVFCYSYNIWN